VFGHHSSLRKKRDESNQGHMRKEKVGNTCNNDLSTDCKNYESYDLDFDSPCNDICPLLFMKICVPKVLNIVNYIF